MFGKRLMRLREARGLSVADTAKALELVPRTYTSYEKNEREPNAEVLIKIALYFGVSTDYLLGVPAKEKTLSSVDDDKVEALAERLFRLGDNELLQLADYLDYLEWKLNLKKN